MIDLYNMNNMDFETNEKADLIYGDCIYESMDFAWAEKYWEMLKPDGVFIVQTDFHTVAEWGVYLKKLPDSIFISHSVWKCEWGNHPKNKPHQCFDDIWIFAKGKNYKWYPERIQIEKATAKSKGLNRFGKDTKTATAWIDDIVLTTVAKERVKKKDGHLIRWQKPLRLYDRIISPFIDTNDVIIDPFMGSGSLGKWCNKKNINYYGIELDKEPYELALENVKD